MMREILVRNFDSTNPDPVLDLRGCRKRGMVDAMMKKFFVIFILLLLIPASLRAANMVRAFTCLTGGTTGCLDKISRTEITNGDFSLVMVGNVFYFYQYDSTATDAESSPSFIRPDDYSSAGVWKLSKVHTSELPSPISNVIFGGFGTSKVICSDGSGNLADCSSLKDANKYSSWTFDPKAVCDGDVDRLFLMSAHGGNGIKIKAWKISFQADPTTELDLDLKRADAWIGVANAAVMDVLDTTSGVASESNEANINSDTVVAEGKVIYLEFGTAYTATGQQVIFEMWYKEN